MSSQASIHSREGSTNSQSRANWNPEFHKVFVYLCVEKVQKCNRPSSSLSKNGWSELCKEFTRKTTVVFDKKQMKNHWDSTKDSWKAWNKLVSNTGGGWDPIKQTFTAPDNFWEEYLRKNKNAVQFRYKGLQFCSELDYMFGGTFATGFGEWCPNAGVMHNYILEETPPQAVSQSDTMGEKEAETQHSSDDEVGIEHIHPPPPQGVKRKKLSGAAKLSNTLEKLVDCVESRKKVCTQAVDSECSMKDCIALLNETTNVTIGSEIYYVAVDLFKKKINREAFFYLPMEARFGWLERHMRS